MNYRFMASHSRNLVTLQVGCPEEEGARPAVKVRVGDRRTVEVKAQMEDGSLMIVNFRVNAQNLVTRVTTKELRLARRRDAHSRRRARIRSR